MTINSAIPWIGRTLGLIIAVMLLADTLSDNNLSIWSRLIVIGVASVVFLIVTWKQGVIARRYEGCPVTREWPFRWVVTLWFASITLLLVWILYRSLFPGQFSTVMSTLVWLQFVESTLFFFGRWWAIGQPQLAGPGETGSAGQGGGT